jgi:hypothetical protein
LKSTRRDALQSEIRGDIKTRIAMRVPAGTHHLVVRFIPDDRLKVLRVTSLVTLFVWLFAEIAMMVNQRIG